ncbi:MAG: hypothetical protein K2X10_06210 [Hyphomicrobiales bacterium]|nr:hypothetical protein [Hyphomicrobiales bacterium]OQW81432.1 MAG: hypothetical protein BVN31_11025 [Proteobacteria bacterium ST_bin15]
MKKLMVALLAALTFAAAFAPQEAEAQYRRRNNGVPIIAGVAAGLLGAAIVGSAIAGQQPRYYQQEPVYGHPGRVYYAQPQNQYYSQGQYYEEDEVVVRQPRCFIKRQPLYDEYGRVAAYQNRRVCR